MTEDEIKLVAEKVVEFWDAGKPDMTLKKCEVAIAAMSFDARVTKLETTLRQIVEAFDTGNLEMNSPRIGVGDEPPHPWHEEWLHYARATLAETTP